MPKFRKKPVVIDATQWWQNGDHPDDYDRDANLDDEGRRQFEGQVVRYFRRPDVPADKRCQRCHRFMQYHGFIDTLEGGHVVCPGDFIITGVKGEKYPCKPDVFDATYEAVATDKPAPMLSPAEIEQAGGPAFPTPETPDSFAVQGMTLRDYFAAGAMAALVEGYDFEAREKSVIKTERTGFDDMPHKDGSSDATFASQLAGEAYIIADAMLAARRVPPLLGAGKGTAR